MSTPRLPRKASEKVNKTEEKESLQTKVKHRLNTCLSGWDDNRSGSGSSIYVVPRRLRRGNEEAYTPRVISIGPIHHGKEHLQAMEANKSRYVRSFLNRLPYHPSDFIAVARTWEKRARDSYQNVLNFSSDEFVTMILVDGIFIVELLLRYNGKVEKEKDDIFQKNWMWKELLHDMILLENQLPFFILDDLFLIAANYLDLSVSFRDLAWNCFKEMSKCSGSIVQGEINHLLDLIYCFCSTNPPKCDNESKFRHEYNRSAAELHAAGVKFIRATSDSCSQVDIKFDRTAGTLTIPPLRVDEWTEPLLRNLIAYEQCHHDHSIISSYVTLMDILINTSDDVRVLADDPAKIIENSLGELDEVYRLFNNLYKRTTMDSSHFCYASVCEELNKYSKDPWHQSNAALYRSIKIFKRDYLSNPWKFISVVAAVILLVLTVIQTVCSVLSLKR